MATVVKMPKWGLTMTVGTVTDWLIEEGAEVSEGDPIFTVETEKAVNDVEAPTDGFVIKLVASQGDEVPVSAAVAIIAAHGEVISDEEVEALVRDATPVAVTTVSTDSGAASGGRSARSASRDEGGRINASPAARRLATELGVDLGSVEATGPEGRITSEDVERAAVAARLDPTPREERIALADRRELNVLLAGAGSGPPLVFLHGLGGSQSTWQVVLVDLVDAHRTASFDLPGHGASDKSAGADYSVGGLAAAITEGIVALGITRPILIGHSLGGAIALKMAASASIAGVVAIDSAGLGKSVSTELTDLMTGDPGPETARGLLELFYEDRRLVVDRGVQEMAQAQLVDGAWTAQQNVAHKAFNGGSQLDGIRIECASVPVPVLLIWGEHDRVLPAQHGLDSLGLFPDATFALVGGVGHVPQVENAPRTAQLIRRFAKSLA